MITITDRAVAKIRSLQAEKAAAEDSTLRVFVETGGCSGLEYGMSFDQPRDGDETITAGGLQLLVDPKSLAQLKGSEIDFDDGLMGKGFEVRNPNAKETCGCGRSFN